MPRTRRVPLSAIGIIIPLALCLLDTTGADPQLPARPSPARADVRLSWANLRFGVKLLSELMREQPGRNVFVSPASVAMALAMTYNGAAGETAQAMAKTLELGDLAIDQLNDAYLGLKTGLQTAGADEVSLSIANSLWARQGIPFNPTFFDVNRKFYDAPVTTLDFLDPRSASIINDWVARKTRNMISRVVSWDDMMGRDIWLYLINAVYFEGRWVVPFDRDDTKGGYFTLTGGGTKVMPMMSRWGDYAYLQTPDFQAVMLPYRWQQGRLGMVVALPAVSSSLTRLCGGLTAEKWSSWLGSMRPQFGRIGLPRFTIEAEASLKRSLSALGMGVAFDPHRADFGKMTSSRPWMDDVTHKTRLLVNEEGTKAAAATSVGMAGCPAPPNPFEMIVNRPFLCAIWDYRTGTALFMGAITDPQIPPAGR